MPGSNDGGKAVREGDANDGGGVITSVNQSTVFSNDLLNSVDGSIGTTHSPILPDHIAGLWFTDEGAIDVTAEDIPMNHEFNTDTCGHIRLEGSNNVFIHAPGVMVEDPPIVDTSIILSANNLVLNGLQTNPPALATAFGEGIIANPEGPTEFEAAQFHADEPTEDIGFLIIPTPLSAGGGGGTPAEFQKSVNNGYNPDRQPPLEETYKEIVPPPIEEKNPNPVPKPDKPLPPPEEPIVGCVNCDENICGPNYLDSCPLSPNFTLGGLSTQTIISNYKIRAQAKLTKDQIVCNLKNLANNSLEPIKAMFPTMYITSGFRHGSGSSKHHLGQAADVQFKGFNTQQYWDAVNWVKDNVPYDAIIYEYGRKPWIHIQFRCSGNRGIVQTRVSPGNYKPGLIRLV